jgi:hypothetical protein
MSEPESEPIATEEGAIEIIVSPSAHQEAAPVAALTQDPDEDAELIQLGKAFFKY